MTMIRFACATVLSAVTVVGATGLALADDKKPAAPAAMPSPAAPPAPAAPMKAAPPAPAAKAPAAAPAVKPAAAPAAAAPAAAAPPAAAAAAPAAPPMPAPSKELEAFMKGFEGSWKCETKFAAGAMGPGSPEATTKTTVKFKKEYGGFGWHGSYKMAKSKLTPELTGELQFGFDSGSNQLTTVGYDSMGGSSLGAGPISGDSAVTNGEGYMMGMKVKLRDTMTKKAPKEIAHKFEVDLGKGFQTLGEDTCKK